MISESPGKLIKNIEAEAHRLGPGLLYFYQVLQVILIPTKICSRLQDTKEITKCNVESEMGSP